MRADDEGVRREREQSPTQTNKRQQFVQDIINKVRVGGSDDMVRGTVQQTMSATRDEPILQ